MFGGAYVHTWYDAAAPTAALSSPQRKRKAEGRWVLGGLAGVAWPLGADIVRFATDFAARTLLVYGTDEQMLARFLKPRLSRRNAVLQPCTGDPGPDMAP